MSKREYQYGFSENSAAMHDVHGRTQKARTMLAVLNHHFKSSTGDLRLLDVGASTGIIDHFLAHHFGEVVGIDIDSAAVEKAKVDYGKDNLIFRLSDAMAIDCGDDAFDVVICSQVYEHVPDAFRMMSEIFRVLKPGGVCYFAASNRIMWNEPHYNLPLLSLLPRPLAHIYVRLFRKARHYHELHFSYWGLKSLVGKFEVLDYTRSIVESPGQYAAEYMLPPGTLKAHMALVVAKYLYWAMPGYVWLLRKPYNPAAKR